MKLPVRFYDTNGNGDLMSRFTNDVDTIGQMLSSTLVQLFSGALSLVGTGADDHTNIWLTLVTLVMTCWSCGPAGRCGPEPEVFAQQSSRARSLCGGDDHCKAGSRCSATRIRRRTSSACSTGT